MADVLILFGNRPDLPMKIEERHLEAVRKSCGGNVYYYQSEEEAMADGIDADVLFFWGGSGKMPEAWCTSSKKLKWMNTFSAGINAIMDSELSTLPVQLTNAKGIHGKTMAVTAIGYVIMFLRQFPESLRLQKEHTWDKSTVVRQEPSGMTMGIIGAGAIGSDVARLAKALEMRVIGVKRSVSDLEFFDKVYSNSEMNTVLEESDFVVLLTPLTEETRHLIGMEQLKKMKDSAVLINIARGPVVDTDALIEALQKGIIGGAALDAVDPEPLDKGNPLWDMDNVIITPHCSADSTLYMDRAMGQFCDNLESFESGKPLFNEIDMTRKY